MDDFNSWMTLYAFHAARTRPAPDPVEDERHGYAVAEDIRPHPLLGSAMPVVSRLWTKAVATLAGRRGTAADTAGDAVTPARAVTPAGTPAAGIAAAKRRAA